jgi:hypothetical protein
MPPRIHLSRLAAAAALSAGALLVGQTSDAQAQAAGSSGAQAAEGLPPATGSTGSAASATGKPTARSHGDASPAMRTGTSPDPTGPNTSTVQPDTSDLSGSTGASITQSQGTPPPGVTPPNGSAPNTGAGAAVDNVPNTEGGPH